MGERLTENAVSARSNRRPRQADRHQRAHAVVRTDAPLGGLSARCRALVGTTSQTTGLNLATPFQY
jgi:hypothetical protein